jgi:hypothetical protein
MSFGIYEDLPDDPERAFLQLEGSFRDVCDQRLENVNTNEYFPGDIYLQYMRRTLAAAQELQLGIFIDYEIPRAENLTEQEYRDFCGMVEHYVTTIRIRLSRRNKEYSVRFDSKTKRIISHHIAQIREIIIVLEVDDWKREALLSRLNDLQNEVDTDRASYGVFAAFIIEAAGVVGVSAEKMEPARRLIDSIAGLIWGAKHAEQTKQIPPPTERKPLPPPRTTKAKSKRGAMDDEIPF